MRIGIDCRMYSSSFTGIGRYVFELVRNLKQNHYVLFFNEPEYHHFSPPHDRITKVLVNARHYSLNEQWKFFHILQRQKLDLMHFTHFNAPLLFRGPSVVTIHDLTLSFYPGKKMTRPWHRLAYHAVLQSTLKKARRVIAVSENTKQDLQKLCRVPAEKIRVIYEGVDAQFRPLDVAQLASVRKKYTLQKPFLLYVGVWRDHKNLVGLIRAFHILRTQKDLLLVITGKEDAAYPEVKATVYKLGLQDFVRFPGMVPENELVALYNAAMCYVQPSYYEGFGLNILEAFACGTPIATSSRSCLPEIAGEGNALFFDPDNVQEMAEVILRIVTDKDLRARLRGRGFERVKNFSWEKMARETLNVYNEAVCLPS